MSSDAVMVDTITGSEVAPTWAIWVSGQDRTEQKPRRSAESSFDVNLIPAVALPLSFQNTPMIMPERMANTAPPTMGTTVPKTSTTAASAALVTMPGARVRIVLMGFFLD